MNDIQTALSYLNKDRVLHASLLEVLRRGSGQLLGAEPAGVILLDRVSGVCMLSTSTSQAADRLLRLLPGRCDLFVGCQPEYAPRVQAALCIPHLHLCYSAAYVKTNPLPLPEFDGELRLLDPSWAPWIYRHYSHAFGPLSYYQGALERGMLGAFPAGAAEPAGFVGFHEEGSIGMLEVLPAYRRQGLGILLLSGAVNLALERGVFPFGQIFEDNSASLALQRRVGMTISPRKMYWLMAD